MSSGTSRIRTFGTLSLCLHTSQGATTTPPDRDPRSRAEPGRTSAKPLPSNTDSIPSRTPADGVPRASGSGSATGRWSCGRSDTGRITRVSSDQDSPGALRSARVLGRCNAFWDVVARSDVTMSQMGEGREVAGRRQRSARLVSVRAPSPARSHSRRPGCTPRRRSPDAGPDGDRLFT
jgi:hypothetical protein